MKLLSFAVMERMLAHRSALAMAQPEQAHTMQMSGVAQVWRATLTSFCTHAGPVLATAFVGFAACLIISAAADTAIRLHIFQRMRSASYSNGKAISISEEHQGAFNVVLAAQTCLSLMSGSFARGAIFCIVLRNMRMRDAYRATFTRFPALFAGSLIYCTLIVVGTFSLNVHLQTVNLDLGDNNPFGVTVSEIWHATALRGIQALIPDSGMPLKWLSRMNTHFSRQSGLILGIAGAVLIAGTDVLLRFYTIKVFECSQKGQLLISVFVSVKRSICFGLKHFALTVMHVWLLRLVMLAIYVLFVALPMTLTRGLVLPHASRFMDGLDVVDLDVFLCSISLALLAALLNAFCGVYDIQLHEMLKIQQRGIS